MTLRNRLSALRVVSPALVLAALFLATLPATPAAAQGFFDRLFGGDRPNTYQPRQGNSYATPWGNNDDRYGNQDRPAAPQASSGGGRSAAFCVRLCDGRYFPMPRHANATAVQLCSGFCPAAKTQVFNGSEIDHAVATTGARYADLENAFVYRKKLVDNCTCNGKDAFGLAKIDVANDPTLKPGDIVSSGDNVKVALTAMMAAKERREAAVTEQPDKRAPPSRRVASQPAPSTIPAAPALEPEERPED